MLDLEQEVQQQSLVDSDGVEHPVDTSFRVWLRFGRNLREQRVFDPIVLRCEPFEGWQALALDFFLSPVPTPRDDGGRGERTLDYWMDQDYIAGSFLHAYGIDLTRQDIHWHLFLALVRSLPEGTKMREVMGYRSYTGAKRSQDSQMRELRDAWRLPQADTAERRDAVAMQLDWFGDVAPAAMQDD